MVARAEAPGLGTHTAVTATEAAPAAGGDSVGFTIEEPEEEKAEAAPAAVTTEEAPAAASVGSEIEAEEEGEDDDDEASQPLLKVSSPSVPGLHLPPPARPAASPRS